MPLTAPQHQQAYTGLVLSVDQHPATPVCAAGDTFDGPPVDLDRRCAVAVPGPIRRRTDRLHDAFRTHLWQRATKATQQREAQPVDADVVVFPVLARRLQQTRLALETFSLDRQIAVAVDDI